MIKLSDFLGESISEALKERGFITKTRVVVFPEDGECEASLLESLKNEPLHK